MIVTVEGWPAVVEITSTAGKTYREEVREWVSRELPEKQAFVIEKFRGLVKNVGGAEAGARVIAAVENLEEGGVQGILNAWKN